MENNSTLYKIFYQLKSIYPSEVLEARNNIYLKEKSKVYLIKNQEGKTIISINTQILEEYQPTLNLFQNREFIISEEFNNPPYIEIIVKYLYFKEIDQIPLGDIFHLLKFSFFFKIKSLGFSILSFLKENLNDFEKVAFIYRKTHEFVILFINDDGWIFMKGIINKCMRYLIKNNYIEEMCSIFKENGEFIKKMQPNMEEFYQSVLKNLQKCNMSDEIFNKILVNLNESTTEFLNKKFDNFNSDVLYQMISQEKPENVQDKESKDIDKKAIPNKFLEKNEKIINRNQPDQSNLQLLEKNEKINKFLIDNFPAFNQRNLLYDSTINEKNISNLISTLENRRNVVFLFEPLKDKIILGAYYSIALPLIAGNPYKNYLGYILCFCCLAAALWIFTWWGLLIFAILGFFFLGILAILDYKDVNSCIFEINSNRIYYANPDKNGHFRVEPDKFYKHDPSSFYVEYNMNTITYGKKTSCFRGGDTSFGIHQEKNSRLKRVLIYELMNKNL